MRRGAPGLCPRGAFLSGKIERSGAPMSRNKSRNNSSGATLGFEERLWQAADKMRGHIDRIGKAVQRSPR